MWFGVDTKEMDYESQISLISINTANSYIKWIMACADFENLWQLNKLDSATIQSGKSKENVNNDIYFSKKFDLCDILNRYGKSGNMCRLI